MSRGGTATIDVDEMQSTVSPKQFSAAESTPGTTTTSSQNHSPSDIQMQLLHLEQQNRIHLMLVRQEQEGINLQPPSLRTVNTSTSGVRDGPGESVIPADPRGRALLQESHIQATLTAAQIHEHLSRKRQEQNSVSIEPPSQILGTTLNESGSGSSTVARSLSSNADGRGSTKRKRSSGMVMTNELLTLSPTPGRMNQAQRSLVTILNNEVPHNAKSIEDLRQRFDVLEAEKNGLRTKLPSEKQRTFLVLHKIRGDDLTSFEVPTWILDRDGTLHLKAKPPLVDSDLYLEGHSSIAFVVERDYCAYTVKTTERKRLPRFSTIPPPEPIEESVRLISSDLIAAFQAFISTKPDFRKCFPELDVRSALPAPYMWWYRYRLHPMLFDQLQPPHQELMRMLTTWIEHNYKQEYEDVHEQFSNRMISHNLMDYLVQPGDVLISDESEDPRETKAYMATSYLSRSDSGRSHNELQSVDSLLQDTHSARVPWHWNVNCWSMGFDGRFSKITAALELALFTEHRDTLVNMKCLNVIPLLFASEEIRAQLEKRGRTFWSCRKRKLVSYVGDEKNAINVKKERYMIDFAAYKGLHSNTQANETAVTRHKNPLDYLFTESMANDNPPMGPELYLFPTTVMGYNLQRQKWLTILVDGIEEVVWDNNKETFNNLVIKDSFKEVVQALVVNRFTGVQNIAGVQRNDTGLIVLLHGGPGTGKTFTAESIAEMSKKPLINVDCGERTDPEEVETYLDYILHLGRLWNCVVLLDEADVFLQERSPTDARRNAITSAFLRALRHYDRTLILTSKRVGTFHEVFKSRFPLALQYDSPTQVQRSHLWTNFMNRVRLSGVLNIDSDDIEPHITELSAYPLNGRQIRQVVLLALELARSKQALMSHVHLKQAIEIADNKTDNWAT